MQFINVPNAEWDQRLTDMIGFPLRTDGGAEIPLYGRLFIGGEPISEDKMAEFGVEVVRDASGKPVEMDTASYKYKRKVYVPGEFHVVVARGHEIVDGEPASVVLRNMFRLSRGPRFWSLTSNTLRGRNQARF